MIAEKEKIDVEEYTVRLDTEQARIEYLKYLCSLGWKKYLQPQIKTKEEFKIYKERLKYELDILTFKQFVSYFLMVQDYVNYAKSNGINVGPGRGSGAGSLVAYLLNITEVNPVKNKLMFERFLNPALPIYDFQIDKSVDIVKKDMSPMKLSQFPRWNTLNLKQQETSLLEYRYILRQQDFYYLIKLKKEDKHRRYDNTVNSFVCYLLQLTDQIPDDIRISRLTILEPGSFAVPDFDVDFADEHRKSVIEYIFNKYGGIEYCSAIGTRQTLKCKNVIRDVCRVFDFPIPFVNDIIKLIESTDKMSSSNEVTISLEEAISRSPELQELSEEYPMVFQVALKLEGLPRNEGKHAAGLIVTPEPITNYIPLRKPADDTVPVSQLDMLEIAALGLLKVDILGLRTLSIIGDCVKYIENRTGNKIELRELEGDDYPEVWRLLNKECYSGIFQVDGSQEMNRLCLELKPNCKNDLSALVALHRPGPLSIGLHNKYIHRKHGHEKINYVHDDVQNILEDTYGVMIYQEQLIQIAQAIAGYNAVQADELRKAISKSKPEMIEKQRGVFLDGCKKYGVDVEIAEKLFEDFTKFGAYAFNRAHSASYGEIAFRTAWLKTYYPVEFYCSLLNHTIDSKTLTAGAQISKYSKEMKKFFGIKLLPPSVNKSKGKFTIESDTEIRYGLSSIKGVGDSAVPIIEGAQQQFDQFESFKDFIDKVREFDSKGLRTVNKRVQEAMIKAGCFDNIGFNSEIKFLTRGLLLELREQLIGSKKIVIPDEYFQEKNIHKQKYEKEVMNMVVTGEVLSPYKKIIREYGMITLKQIKKDESGQIRMVGCEIVDFAIKQDKKGRKMCFLTVEDQESSDTVAIFSNVFEKTSDFCTKKGLAIALLVKADFQGRLLVSDIKPIESLSI